ncbi:hypothetical protein EV424DRAFT_1372518 [Suillus variegatus]|nr:hypothetical protein EV424DRAFT_1372518 [Suillus variegatus]
MVHQPSRRRTRSINSQYLPRSVFISTWISTAMLLAIFNISKAVENGVGITPSLIHHQPRSAKAIALIQQDANY